MADDRPSDPYERLRRGRRRIRMLTATLGAAALAGTGALTVTLAAQNGSAQATSSTIQNSTSTTGGTVSQPQQQPASGGSGSVQAVSGGS